MKNLIFALAIMMIMTGCITESTALSDYEKHLDWVHSADPESDARNALSKGDFRLMTVPGRGEVIPGVKASERSAYSLKCGTRLIPGMSDAVRNEQHLRLLKKASEYGARYNWVIMDNCKP